jgi:hypothetical protein
MIVRFIEACLLCVLALVVLFGLASVAVDLAQFFATQ